MSSLAPASTTWDGPELETKGNSPWKVNPAPPEEDALLEVALETASAIVSDQFDEDEPMILSAAFERAQEFLRTESREIKKRFGYFPPTPNILPGPNGSADIHWEQPGWGLLVNIPATDELATFYGDCAGNGRVKGNLDPKSWHLGITSWLSKQ
jgi:hypothetical protein